MQSLPQLEVSTYSSQIFWLFITFSILYFFISKSFIPKILDILKKREEYFFRFHDEISVLLKKIENIKLTNKNILENSKNQVSEISKNLQIQKENRKKQMEDELNIKLHNIENKFKSDIQNNFELNKQKIFNNYQQINNIFSEEFFKSQKDLLKTKDLDEKSSKIFEENFLLKKQNFQ